jgi:hypothetical protein
MMYISVVNGKKMMPRIGQSQLPLKAVLTIAGRASQRRRVPSRGKRPANIANRQGIV